MSILPQDQVFWYLNRQQDSKSLTQDCTTDVLVIGGGIAGLTAAQSFKEKGLDVILVEKNYCGSGASGKSSGFITPDSEMPLHELIRLHGETQAKKIWEFGLSGVNIIKKNIQDYGLDCDYQEQQTLVLANTHRALTQQITAEHKARQRLHYQSRLYTQEQLPEILGSSMYQGGLLYPGSFGINAYRYCLGMRKVLLEQGVKIYEDTPVIEVKDHVATTPYATINAKHIVLCADRFTPFLQKLTDKIYHVQTFLMLSAPLTPQQAKAIFPDENYMVWDTDLIYNYYRLTGDNRLMLGGASLLYTYASEENHNSAYVAKKLISYLKKKFPNIKVNFEYIWPGLIGISKDILPLAGADQDDPSLYYIAAAAGLPWAAALGAYSAEHIINKEHSFDDYFSPYRNFTLGPVTQSLIGTRLTFALSNFLSVGSL